jgi:hypothetical protein
VGAEAATVVVVAWTAVTATAELAKIDPAAPSLSPVAHDFSMM